MGIVLCGRRCVVVLHVLAGARPFVVRPPLDEFSRGHACDLHIKSNTNSTPVTVAVSPAVAIVDHGRDCCDAISVRFAFAVVVVVIGCRLLPLVVVGCILQFPAVNVQLKWSSRCHWLQIMQLLRGAPTRPRRQAVSGPRPLMPVSTLMLSSLLLSTYLSCGSHIVATNCISLAAKLCSNCRHIHALVSWYPAFFECTCARMPTTSVYASTPICHRTFVAWVLGACIVL